MRGLGRVGSGVGRTLGRGIKYGAIGAGAGLAVMGTLAVKASMEAQKATAQTRAGIKSTGGAANISAKQIDALSRRVMNYSGISDEAVKSSSNILLTFTKIRNEAGKGNKIFTEVTKITADLSTRLGKDLNSSALMVGKALNDPVKGVTALGRAGVQFTEQQKEQIETLVESGKTLKAQRMILRELQTQVGGSARAAGRTAEGQMRIAMERIGNALEQIGKPLMNVLGAVAPVLGNTFASVIRSIGPPLAQLVKVLGRQLGPILTSLGPIFADLVKAAVPIVALLGRVFIRVLRRLMPSLRPLIGAIGKALLSALREVAPYLPQLARAMARLLIAFLPMIPPLAKLVGWFGKLAAIGLTTFLNAVTSVIKPVIKWIRAAWDWVGKLLDRLGAVGRSFGETAQRLPRLGIPTAQHGGPVMAQRPVLVGERGPEIYVPRVAGTIIPNRQTEAIIGRGGATVTMNVTVYESHDQQKTLRIVRKAVTDALARS